MTNIYLLMHQYCYEGAEVVAAYTAKESAEAKRSAMLDEGCIVHTYTDQAGKRLTYSEPTRFTTPVKHYEYKADDLYIDEIELREAL